MLRMTAVGVEWLNLHDVTPILAFPLQRGKEYVAFKPASANVHV